jgi:hypothetical protein
MNSGAISEQDLLAVMAALRFDGQHVGTLERIPDTHWPKLLETIDRNQLTLPLAVRRRNLLPDAIRNRIDSSLASNAVRHARLVVACAEIVDGLNSRNIEFVLLKGLTQWPWYSDQPAHRPQYDIDLYCTENSIARALEVIGGLRYEVVSSSRVPVTDHLPVMIRRTGWRWRGDYFDPDMPPSVELHFRFWDFETERFEAGDVQQFWHNRRVRELEGLKIPALDPVDGLSYSTLHLVRHLLRGDLRLYHAYELAHFLERSADDQPFWNRWSESNDKARRRIAAIAFYLAAEWFGCRMNPAASRAVESLEDGIARWFDLFALSPVTAVTRPNKDEMWLHLSLVDGTGDRARILARRLFPMSRSHVVHDAHLPAAKTTLRVRIARIFFEISFVIRRAIHHARAIGPAALSGFRWWRRVAMERS